MKGVVYNEKCKPIKYKVIVKYFTPTKTLLSM